MSWYDCMKLSKQNIKKNLQIVEKERENMKKSIFQLHDQWLETGKPIKVYQGKLVGFGKKEN